MPHSMPLLCSSLHAGEIQKWHKSVSEAMHRPGSGGDANPWPSLSAREAPASRGSRKISEKQALAWTDVHLLPVAVRDSSLATELAPGVTEDDDAARRSPAV
jgi:hypothetical protein